MNLPQRVFRGPLRLLVMLATTALLLAAIPATFAGAVQASAGASRPTIVLVHGAFADGTAWDEVAARLRDDGYTAVVPELALASVQGDTAIVRSTLDAIPGPKVVVAHSYGGVVASNAATGRSDIRALVLTAAYLPADGESIASLGENYVPPAFAVPPFPPGHLLIDATGSAIIDPQYFRADFAQDLNPKLAARMAAAQRPVSLGILFTPSGPPAWATIPSWYAISAHDRIIDPALQRFMAARAHSVVTTFEAASHAGGFTHYATRFTKLVEQADSATT